ncbi:MAG: pyridoxamine 5'-phosphate oxidase family protein [Candidatus Pacebacteria bacterium]|nr:pyridoxamine 5'-phosphate oxidase family protein [Candidatus Paceibacterota bacterium]
MELSPQVVTALLEAKNKALATTGKHGLNVVPVSTVRVINNKILLMNYFLKKTLENILEQPRVAFVFWSGLEGYQIKGSVEYRDSGDVFEEAKKWVEDNVADRTLVGLLILTPEEMYNVSPGASQ